MKENLQKALLTFTKRTLPVDYCFVCFDTDADADKTRAAINAFDEIFTKSGGQFNYKLFVMERCFETWLLGNRQAYNSSSSSEKFRPFMQFYDVALRDPEKMNAPAGRNISKYHLQYLQEMLRNAQNKKNYSKHSPMAVSDKDYYQELHSRIIDTSDLCSFRDFICFLESIDTAKTIPYD